MNNIPTLLGQQDFMSSNWDMINSAKLEPLNKEQIEINRNKPKLIVWDLGSKDTFVISARQGGKSHWNEMFDLAKNAKIGQTLKIRLPALFK